MSWFQTANGVILLYALGMSIIMLNNHQDQWFPMLVLWLGIDPKWLNLRNRVCQCMLPMNMESPAIKTYGKTCQFPCLGSLRTWKSLLGATTALPWFCWNHLYLVTFVLQSATKSIYRNPWIFLQYLTCHRQPRRNHNKNRLNIQSEEPDLNMQSIHAVQVDHLNLTIIYTLR